MDANILILVASLPKDVVQITFANQTNFKSQCVTKDQALLIRIMLAQLNFEGDTIMFGTGPGLYTQVQGIIAGVISHPHMTITLTNSEWILGYLFPTSIRSRDIIYYQVFPLSDIQKIHILLSAAPHYDSLSLAATLSTIQLAPQHIDKHINNLMQNLNGTSVSIKLEGNINLIFKK